MKDAIDQKTDMQIHDPKFWADCWQKANNVSSICIKKSNQNKWMDFWNSISKTYQSRNKLEVGLVSKTIDLLFREGLLCKDSVVLDIGCGPGTYALPLSCKVSRVVAVDNAQDMLKQLMDEAEKEGISNITPICSMWEECRFNKEFDFVLASFSPAIRNAKNLQKMNKASRKYACIITFSKEVDFYRKIRSDLWEEIMRKPFRSNAFNIIYPFNFLYTNGLRPSVKYVKHSFKYEEPVEQYIRQYESYFKIFTTMNQKKKDKISQYFQNRFNDGIIKVDAEREICVMWWETKKSLFY